MKNNSITSSLDKITGQQQCRLTGFHESVVTFVEQKKNSSFMTVIMTTNTMTMTAILVLPLLY